MSDDLTNRWARRPALARTLRFLVFGAPVVASIVAAMLTRRALPPTSGALGLLGVLAALLAVSGATLLVVDNLARRLLPLVLLLDLRMLFPDRAPSRLRVAREAARRRPIDEQLRRIAKAGGDPSAVAGEILSLVAALSRHDRPTRGHAERVRLFTDLVAEQLRLPARDRDLLRWAAILHDIGKLRVPSDLLNKPGKPTTEEWATLQLHPAHGAEIASALVPWLGQWGDVIIQHHERYDGTGYPLGLQGPEISVGARIVAAADAFDVMTAQRPYRRPVSRQAALAELVRFSGTQFDPVVVRAMVSVGAPRLRRAQGILAMIADTHWLASETVPVAVLGRAVGAGALATGVVAAAPAISAAPPQAANPVVQRVPAPGDLALQAAGTQGARSGTSDLPTATSTPGSPIGIQASSDAVSPPPSQWSQPSDTSRSMRPPGASGPSGASQPAHPSPSSQAAPPSSVVGPRTSGRPAGPGAVGGVVGGVTGTVGTVTGTVTGVVDGTVDGVTDTVDGVVGTVTGVVGGSTGATLDDTVGTVTSTVDDTVGTVTDTVDGTVGTVTGLVGGLLGRR
jgi:HD-GYP domain-containing protein (c-di-GMP phosphodiesterase class II)